MFPGKEWFGGVESLIGGLLEPYGVEVLCLYLWQGRARGLVLGETCPVDSDVDVYVQVADRMGHGDLDWLNSLIRGTGRPVQGYMTWVDGYKLDARIGVGPPGEEPFVSFGELEG